LARTPVNFEEKREQIVQAALITFSKYGYEGTTNKLIAQEAGKLMGQDGKPISPGLIYHYFPEGKAQLFYAVLEQLPSLQKFKEVLAENLDKPPEIFLKIIARTYNEILMYENVLSILRLVITEGGRHPEILKTVLSLFVPDLFRPMLGYVVGQIHNGATRVQKPDQIAVQLFAPIVMRRVLLSSLNKENAPFVMENLLVSNDEEFIDTLVNSILAGTFK
jgi:AcrR family transcriptional regulator